MVSNSESKSCEKSLSTLGFCCSNLDISSFFSLGTSNSKKILPWCSLLVQQQQFEIFSKKISYSYRVNLSQSWATCGAIHPKSKFGILLIRPAGWLLLLQLHGSMSFSVLQILKSRQFGNPFLFCRVSPINKKFSDLPTSQKPDLVFR